jgi:hypothetical protein
MPTLRLTALLTCLALATSRLGLVLHELVGHGVTALVLGAKITSVQLFWFAGGWIRYDLPDTHLATTLPIAMGGIALELVCGTALWAGIRRGDLAGRLLRGIGAALVVHAGWYLATGAWHGFGDGVVLHRALGAARYPVALAAGVGTCLAAYAGTRGVAGALAGTLPRRRVLGVAIAVVIAAGLHAGLAIGELRVRRDPTYREVMTSERERDVEAELRRWEQTHPGVAPEVHEREQVRIERAHRTFPFAWLLGALIAGAVIAGALRTRVGTSPITSRMVASAAACAAFAITLVIVLDATM